MARPVRVVLCQCLLCVRAPCSLSWRADMHKSGLLMSLYMLVCVRQHLCLRPTAGWRGQLGKGSMLGDAAISAVLVLRLTVDTRHEAQEGCCKEPERRIGGAAHV